MGKHAFDGQLYSLDSRSFCIASACMWIFLVSVRLSPFLPWALFSFLAFSFLPPFVACLDDDGMHREPFFFYIGRAHV